jgi:glyceraldehyde-3-phosphate dehydrogenase/erythrose-4-phosphate dehydrogenase
MPCSPQPLRGRWPASWVMRRALYAWYDNEMAYACRMVDLACHMDAQGL